MFDITSSKLLLLAIVALLVIGPKDFPVLLRTIGKYMGIIRGHAREFRAQFDEAMRESELAQMRKDMESFAQETEASLNTTKASVEKNFDDARQGVEGSLGADPFAAAPPQPAPAQAAANGADGASPGPAAPPEVSSPPDAVPPDAVPPDVAPASEPAPVEGGHQRIPEAVPAPAPEKAGA
jgi:sec-independent protein translocase protein TatB